MPYLKRPDVQDRLNALAIDAAAPARRTSWRNSSRPRSPNGRKVVKDAGIEPQ